MGKIASITSLDLRFWKLMSTATGRSMAVPLIFCYKSFSLSAEHALYQVVPVIRTRRTMQCANKKPQDLSPGTSFTQRTQTPSANVVNLIPFPTSQADGKYFSIFCTLSPSLQTPQNPSEPPAVRGNLPFAALPLCVFGSALSPLQPWQCPPHSSIPSLPHLECQHKPSPGEKLFKHHKASF